MMGQQVAQGALFYGFRLDDRVPAITCCDASMAFWISPARARRWRQATARPGGPRSIRD